jgi:tetratricopeptide (TPR) repeat protein
MGKTQIALELAFRVVEKYPNCSIFWIPATSVSTLQQAFVDVGRKLGIPNIEKERDTKLMVQRFLSQDSAGQWLLIIDNIDDMDIWEKELKGHLPKSQKGRIVFTSRDGKVAHKIEASNVKEIPQMEQGAATQMLRKYLTKEELLDDIEAAQSLLERLTFLPLAITQAAVYINSNRLNLSEYSSLLDEQEEDVIDLLSEEFEDDTRYPDVKNPVATTWLISFEQMRKRDTLAAEYLSFMACILPKDIPRSLLPPAISLKKKMDAIGTLKAYSFVSGRATDDTLDIHRLVQLATRNWLKKNHQWNFWIETAAARFQHELFIARWRTRNVWTAYLPHAVRVAESPGLSRANYMRPLLTLVAYCQRILNCHKAEELTLRKLLKQQLEELGENHRDTRASLNNLGFALINQGSSFEAEQILRGVVALNKQEDGDKHPDSMTSISNLAHALILQKRYAEAMEMYQEISPSQGKILGKNHPDTWRSLNNLTVILSRQGKQAEAEQMFQKLLLSQEWILGKDHPTTLTSFNNLAVSLNKQGKIAKAEDMYQEVLRIRKRDLGEEHPATLSSMTTLATVLTQQGEYARAEAILREIVSVQEKVVGKEHLQTLNSVGWLAAILYSQEKYEHSFTYFNQAFAGYRSLLGDDHETIRASLGLCLHVKRIIHRASAPATDPKTESVSNSATSNPGDQAASS